MESDLTVWLLWALLSVSLVYFLHSISSRLAAARRLPPGPSPLPIVGNLFALGPNIHLSLHRLSETYGPVMSLKLGAVTTIVITSRDAAREVLQKKDQAFAGRSIRDATRAAGHNAASLAWLPANQRWRSLRKVCSANLFTNQRLTATQDIRKERVRQLLDYLRRSEGKPVDVGRAAFGMIINLISNTLFSADVVDIYDDESPQEFKDLMWRYMEEVGAPNLSDFFPVLRSMDLQGKRRRVGVIIKKLHRIFDGFVDGRLKERAEKTMRSAVGEGDFLDAMLDWEFDGSVEEKRHAMRCTFADLFFGGTDTTSTTMEWAMAELMRNPRVMKKLRAELASEIGEGKQVEEGDIGRLQYLQAVVKETLRLHPAAPLLLPHSNDAATEVCGYVVPEGSQVLINVWAIARDKGLWEAAAEEFRPERFVGVEVDYRGQDFELLPFGAGRRICPGLPLAYRMLHLILGSLVNSFDWGLPEGKEGMDVDMSEKFGITLAMAVPLKLVPIPVKVKS